MGVIIQAGIRGFVEWFREKADDPVAGGQDLATAVFGAAPRALTGAITLQQAVDLVRLGIEVVEENIEGIVSPPSSRVPARWAGRGSASSSAACPTHHRAAAALTSQLGAVRWSSARGPGI